MHVLLISLHVLSGVFWAGSALTIARAGSPATLSRRLVGPQMGSAIVAIATGGYLGHALHAADRSFGFGVLAAGAGCALLAFVLQIVSTFAYKPVDDGRTQKPAAAMQVVAAAMLVLSVLAMASFRYIPDPAPASKGTARSEPASTRFAGVSGTSA